MDINELRARIEEELVWEPVPQMQVSTWIQETYAELAGVTLADLIAWQAQKFLLDAPR